MMNEAFDSETYALEQKIVKGKSDISYVFADEDGDRYRIQFLASPKLGKGVVKVYVGKAKSAKLFVDKIDRFANPKAMIATVINFFTEHLLTPEGMQLRGFVIDMSGAASVRAIPLMKKVIKSTLVSKVKPWMGADFNPVDNRKYLWVYKSTLKPQEVFDGVGVPTDAPWFTKDTKADTGTEKRAGVDNTGSKTGEADVIKKFETSYVTPFVESLKKKYPLHSFTYKIERGGSFAPKHLPITVSIHVDSVFADSNFFSMDMGSITLSSLMGKNIDLKIKEIDKKIAEEKIKKVEDSKAASQRAITGVLDGLLKLYPSFKGKLSMSEISQYGLPNGVNMVSVEITYEGRKIDVASVSTKDISTSVNLIADHFKKIGIDGVRPVLAKGDKVTIKDPSRENVSLSNTPIFGTVVDYDSNFVSLKVGTGGMTTRWDNISTEEDYLKDWNARQTSKVKSSQTSDGKLKPSYSKAANQLIDSGFKNVTETDNGLFGTDKGYVGYRFATDGEKVTHVVFTKTQLKVSGIEELKSIYNQLAPHFGAGLALSNIKIWSVEDNFFVYDLDSVELRNQDIKLVFKASGKYKAFGTLELTLEFKYGETDEVIIQGYFGKKKLVAPKFFKTENEFKFWTKGGISEFLSEYSRDQIDKFESSADTDVNNFYKLLKPYQVTTGSANNDQFTVEKYTDKHNNKVVLSVECRGYPADAEKKLKAKLASLSSVITRKPDSVSSGEGDDNQYSGDHAAAWAVFNF